MDQQIPYSELLFKNGYRGIQPTTQEGTVKMTESSICELDKKNKKLEGKLNDTIDNQETVEISGRRNMNVSQYMLNNETTENQETVEISGRRNMNVSQYMLNNETTENQETVEISGRRNMNVSQYMLNNKPDFNMTTEKTVVTARDDLEGFRIKEISTFLGQKQFECPWEKWQTPKTTSLLKWKFMDPDNSNIPKTKEDFNMTTEKTVVTARDDLEGFRIKEISTFLGQKQFECPWEKWQTPKTTSLLKWKFLVPDNSNVPKTKEELDKILPVLPIVKQKLEHPPESEIQVTWIGHATMLVQMDGITILTDPVFGEYCGPELAQAMHLGYKRYRSAACQVVDLSHLDAVIISNDHFDHLDWKSAQAINARFPDVKWFVGKNGRDLCPSNYADNVTDMLWWEEAKVMIKGKEFTFACTPAQHWCRRTAFDMNKRLWCSWVVKGPTKNFFFAGDTGYYQPVFQKIGEKYGPFSLAAIPIGCSEPRHILKYQHVNPPEAVNIHDYIKSEQSIAILWGAFHMTNEFYLSPPHDLEKAMGKDRDKFISMQHGETWVVGEDRKRLKFMYQEEF